MPRLVVTTRAGKIFDVEAEGKSSLMEAIRRAGVDDLLAMCGGCCSCATCHVYVEECSLDRLPPMGKGEADLLEWSSHRQLNSRLSCQIPLVDGLDGLHVTVAPED